MLYAGRKTVAVVATPEQMVPPGVRGKCLVCALAANTGKVFVGGEPNVTLFNNRVLTNGPVASSGSEEGFPLSASESLPMQVDAQDVWLAVSVAGEGVSYLMQLGHAPASANLGGTPRF